jgi:hypothetical protein
MRRTAKTNFGDTITLFGGSGSGGHKSACQMSLDDLPEELKKLAELGSVPWTVYIRPLPTVYAGVDAAVYPTATITFGNGGMSLKRDASATVFTKVSGCGSYVEVKLRWTDKFGRTIDPTTITAGTSSIVNVTICVGFDPEAAEPQLWWTAFQSNTLATAVKLPGVGGAPDPRVTMQRLRRLRVRFTGGDGAPPELWVQTHDLTLAPGGGETPQTSDLILPELTAGFPTFNLFDRDFGAQGRDYSRGLWVVMSSTEDTFTAQGGGKWRLEGQLYRLDSGDGTS